jgi:hypothetical protein
MARAIPSAARAAALEDVAQAAGKIPIETQRLAQ